VAGGGLEIRIGGRRFAPSARPLPPEEAVRVIAGYERRNRVIAPVVRRVLSKLAGFRYDGSESARRRLVASLPLIAFRPGDTDLANARTPSAELGAVSGG
jgi:hypothetical protein